MFVICKVIDKFLNNMLFYDNKILYMRLFKLVVKKRQNVRKLDFVIVNDLDVKFINAYVKFIIS